MKFVFAVDSFKGSLSSHRMNAILAQTAQQYFPQAECICVDMADGGEGTLEAIDALKKGEKIVTKAHDPLLNEIESDYRIWGHQTAMIEMAKISGLCRIPYREGNALYTSSLGTGELIKDALDRGCRHIYISIGGSATNDGGIGAMTALGVRFCGASGLPVKPIGKELSAIQTIDITQLDPRIQQTTFTVLCDVTNPLTGPQGATAVFGEQKGAVGEAKDLLEEGMRHYADLLNLFGGRDINTVAGSGAAGGLGAAFITFLQAELRPGIETILDLTHFDDVLKGADYVITGEGKIDEQSCHGKVISGIAKRAKKENVPVIAITARLTIPIETLQRMGIQSAITTVNDIMTLDEAMRRAEELFLNASRRLFAFIRRE